MKNLRGGLGAAAALLASLALSGCGGALRSQQAPAHWSTGFWFWQGSSTRDEPFTGTLDTLFVQAGSIYKLQISARDPGNWTVDAGLPADLPAAREYWLVLRAERQRLPDQGLAAMIAKKAGEVLESARQRHLNAAGIQLDIDCPTASLGSYARFIREIRAGLPPGAQISITALLDWFRPNTDIDELIKAVDEFVPQFYDAGGPNTILGEPVIATKFDAAAWAPKLNRFGKRYRVGISTFGRARYVWNSSSPNRTHVDRIFNDVKPLDFATDTAFRLEVARNEESELVLTYRATRNTHLGYNDFARGDAIQFVLSTPEQVRGEIDAARKMGGNCAGIVFFRWPQSNEALAMHPDEVLAAAGLESPKSIPVTVATVAGSCAVVHCADLYLINPEPLVANGTRYRIHSSVELEYFLPEEKVPARMSDPSGIEVMLPPYCGRGRLFLGRVVSSAPAKFSVEKEP